MRLFRKALMCLKENGWKETWVKIRYWLIVRYQLAFKRKALFTREELNAQKEERFKRNIKFSILTPLYNTPKRFLRETIKSVLDQSYENWELCLVDGSDKEHDYVETICRQTAEQDKRIRYVKLKENLGISDNTNACIDMSTGDYLALLDHDDLLHPAALHECMKAVCENDADFIYTDEATFKSPNKNRLITEHYKPDFALDNLRANNYICHFTAFSRELQEKTGKFRSEYNGSQDHDMILRLSANAKRITHIPEILYYWRAHSNSVSADIGSKEYAIEAGKNAVRASIAHCGYRAEIESSAMYPTIYRIRYELKGNPKISIIIPNKDHFRELKRCIDSITSLSSYDNYEIVIADNGSSEEELLEYYNILQNDKRIKICYLDVPFNFAAINNYAAGFADGDYYLFLNNDTEVITPGWMEELLMYAQRDDVGAAGAKLYYPDNTIQHAGIILGMGRDHIAGLPFCGYPRSEGGYVGRLCYAQDMSAVTAACMLIKASLFHDLDGFDEAYAVAYNDVDLCMRIRKTGYLIVWTPYAELYHHESLSRGLDDSPEKRKRLEDEARRFRGRWQRELELGDPYYNPNLTLNRGDFLPKSI